MILRTSILDFDLGKEYCDREYIVRYHLHNNPQWWIDALSCLPWVYFFWGLERAMLSLDWWFGLPSLLLGDWWFGGAGGNIGIGKKLYSESLDRGHTLQTTSSSGGGGSSSTAESPHTRE